MALKNDGAVHVWGNDSDGQRDDIPDGLNNVVSIAAGSFHSMALQNDGTVVVWGNNFYFQDVDVDVDIPDDFIEILPIPDDLNNVVSIVAGGHHSMALKNDGTVVAWGDTEFGQVRVPDDLITRVP